MQTVELNEEQARLMVSSLLKSLEREKAAHRRTNRRREEAAADKYALLAILEEVGGELYERALRALADNQEARAA